MPLTCPTSSTNSDLVIDTRAWRHLEGARRYVTPETGTGLFQYFIKLVPTIYKKHPSATPLSTVRYSYTQRFRPLKIRAPSDEPVEDHHHHAKATSPTAMLPGVFFVYDFSAFMVEVTVHHKTVSICLFESARSWAGCPPPSGSWTGSCGI